MLETRVIDDPWGPKANSSPKTYEELLKDPFMNTAESREIRADSALGHTVALLMHRGERDVAELVLEIETVRVEYDHSDQSWDIWFDVVAEQMSRFNEVRMGRLRDVWAEVCNRLGYETFWIGVREILPSVGPGWREQFQSQSVKRPTNNGRRVRSGTIRFAEDYLAFTNDGERVVYRALRQIQEEDLPRDSTVGIFPLAGGRIPGRTWEPDFLITYRGRAGVLEVDGPHHNGRRAMDSTRDHLLLDAGVAFVDRIPVETIGEPSELNAALRRFLRRLGESR
ncbi:MAG TPA: hypothetical protein VFX16_37525 [Pseudonocardiaceae bacterium]|nr:hypothetical protein [Pseudonocardiaceae bacterium]